MMECKDCGKELKGGFGVGERPFTEYRCSECLMNNLCNEQGVMLLRLIREYHEEHMPKIEGRKYKDYSAKLYAHIQSLIFFTTRLQEIEA